MLAPSDTSFQIIQEFLRWDIKGRSLYLLEKLHSECSQCSSSSKKRVLLLACNNKSKSSWSAYAQV